ncbi:hypothetical protein ACJJTC_018834 [Scirpophaga incertulas]
MNSCKALIWNLVVDSIPATIFDDLFDKPRAVTDIRHQDKLMYNLKQYILNGVENEMKSQESEENKTRVRKDSNSLNEKLKKKAPEVAKNKFQITLLGDSLLAGVGRVLSFKIFGNSPPDLGGFISVVSSSNLPADDDYPFIFVNVNKLFDIPVEQFKKLRISYLYTRWIIGHEKHESEHRIFKPNNDLNIDDHHALPIDPESVSAMTAFFLENAFEIQVRAIRDDQNQAEPKLFGNKKCDKHFGTTSGKISLETHDFLIAVTRIDATCLAKGTNKVIRGEFPLFPPRVDFKCLERAELCTNDMNLTNASYRQNFLVPPDVVLKAQMSLEVSIGIVGCQQKKLSKSFARVLCYIREKESANKIVSQIKNINKFLLQSNTTDDVLTGFALDAGSIVIVYVEGISEGQILCIWDLTRELKTKIRCIYSSSMRYPTRIYPGGSAVDSWSSPFAVLKMHIPLSIILSCPAVYAASALPIPTRSAVLKFGKLISSKSRELPTRNEMPTPSELRSFSLELCVPISPEDVVENMDNQVIPNII